MQNSFIKNQNKFKKNQKTSSLLQLKFLGQIDVSMLDIDS